MDEPDQKAAETLAGTGVEDAPAAPTDNGADDDPLVRRVLEHRYRLDERLGEGGVGVVYRGVHLRLDRPVAIKVLQRAYGDHKPLLLRFEREARAMAALSHPNIVALTDFGVEDGMPYLVMELLEGSTLGEMLDRKPLAPARALDIERQVLRALAYAHGEGLAHRDLQPDNVFLQALPDSTDHVRLLDFGLAKFVLDDDERDGPQVTVAGLAFGTPAYMAPEQAAGRPSSLQTDVYAAGVLLFEMLTGRRPFEGDPTELLRQHILSEPPTLAEMFPERTPSPKLDAVLQRALAKNVDDRFADAGQMLEALAALPLDVIQPVGGETDRADPTGATMLAQAGNAPTIAAGEATAAVQARRGARRVQPIWLVVAAGSALLLLVLGASFGACINDCVADDPSRVVVASDPAAGAWKAPPPAKASPPSKGKGRKAPPAARPAARNPWTVSAVPPVLFRAKQQLDAGERPRESTVKALRAHASQNRDDPRPYLLLARIYLGRRWRSDALDRYERAYDRDPSVRGDPQMLADLVGLVSHEKVGRRAARQVEKIYGAEALPVVDAALAAPDLPSKSAKRLRDLRTKISR